MKSDDKSALKQSLKELFPEAIGAYLFGSASSGDQRPESDIDVAVLQRSPIDPEVVLKLKGFASQRLKRDLDLVDLYRADTVTIAQVVSTGQVIFSRDDLAIAEFETVAYSSYALLNEERAEILADILKTGRIHG